MQVKSALFGDYQTNCYIVTNENNESIIIDAGIGAYEWILEECENPVAIIDTHGHFDHIWSNRSLKGHFNIPLIIHQKDEFMLENDIFGMGCPKSKSDIVIEKDEVRKVGGFEVSFKHFAGHTPGSMTVEISNCMFSGDFVFKGTIGRFDFPYSDKNDMKNSIKKFLKLDYDKIIYPGHGGTTTIKKAQKDLIGWLEII